MMLYQEGRGIAPEKVRAEFHPSGFAMIRLSGTGASVFVHSADEADALIAAACEAKRLLLAKRAPADWCPAYTGPDEELDVAVYCDRRAGHPGNHHGTVGGGEIAWPPVPVSPEAVAALAGSIADGTPLVVANAPYHVTGAEPCCLAEEGGYICNAQDGHDGPDHVAYGGKDEECHRWPVAADEQAASVTA